MVLIKGLFNGEFVIKSVGTTTSFTIDIGIGSIAYPETGTIKIFPTGFVSQGGASSQEDENVSGRMVTAYAGITTTLKGISGSGTALLTTDEIEIDTDYLDIRIGDYLQIDEEIVRVKETVTSDIIKGIPWCDGNSKAGTFCWCCYQES